MAGEKPEEQSQVAKQRERIRVEVNKEVSGESATSHFLKFGTTEPALDPDQIPDSDILMLTKVEEGTLTDEDWRLYEVKLLGDYKQAQEEAKQSGKELGQTEYPRFWFRAYLNNMRSLQRKNS